MPTHTSREYERELKTLRENVVLMSHEVDAMLGDAILALQENDAELAAKTIERDHHINRSEVDLDELCFILLAKRQPMGVDLRLIAVVLKMVTDLERMGDLAVNICERVLLLSTDGRLNVHSDLFVMAELVRKMVRLSMDAFIAEDAEQAECVLQLDDAVDELYHQVVRDSLVQIKKHEGNIEQLIHFQSIAKWLERVGDHCTNLAEFVVFLVRGTDIRHVGKL